MNPDSQTFNLPGEPNSPCSNWMPPKDLHSNYETCHFHRGKFTSCVQEILNTFFSSVAHVPFVKEQVFHRLDILFCHLGPTSTLWRPTLYAFPQVEIYGSCFIYVFHRMSRRKKLWICLKKTVNNIHIYKYNMYFYIYLFIYIQYMCVFLFCCWSYL